MLLLNNEEFSKPKFEKLLKEDTELIPLQEAYFKEGKDMKELLSLLESARNKWVGKTIDEKDKISSSKEMKLFNRKMEKFFGFKTFAIQVVFSESVNAWTYPISSKYDINIKDGKKYISVTSNGYKYTGGDFNCLVCITSKLFTDKRCNTRDIMSIFLHEIGHNFSFGLNGGQSIFGLINRANNTFFYVNTLINTWIMDNDSAHELSSMVYNDEDNKINKLADHLRDKDDTFINISSILMKPLAVLYNIGLIVAAFSALGSIYVLYNLYTSTIGNLSPIRFMCKLYGYKDEKIGDNFATMYGFGPEVAKFEDKIYTIYNNKKPNLFTNLCSIIFLPLISLLNLNDPHPEMTERCLDQIKLLENELLKEDMDEEMKRQIRLDIKNTQIQYTKLEKSMNTYDTTGVRVFRQVMTKLFGGDFRELFINNKKFYGKYDDINTNDKK